MLTIKFSTSGAAFMGDDEYDARFFKAGEIKRILNKIVSQIEDGYDNGPIMDLNGNKIGTFELSE